MNAAALEKLAAHLESGTLQHVKFDFSSYNEGEGAERGCGTAGCALGECPALFPERWTWGLGFDIRRLPQVHGMRRADPTKHAAAFFGITEEASEHLFIAGYQEPSEFGGVPLGNSATREEVAANIRAFLAIKNNLK